MAYDFQGSIAQQYITFSVNVVTEVVPGENFYKVMLFMGDAEADASLVTAPAVGDIIEILPSTYTTLSKGPLLGYLGDFYAHNTAITVYVVIYDDALVTAGTFVAGAVTALTTQFAIFKDRAYFKLMTLHDNIPGNSALATLCKNDALLSQCWISANDAQMLVDGSTTSMSGVCKLAGSDPVVVYHPDVDKDPALVQLGLTLGALNDSGTPVGNSMDYLATDSIVPSGTSGANPTASNVTALTNANAGFFLTIGDGTGHVANKGGKTVLTNLAGAQWITQYINYTSAVKTANYLVQMNRFKNNTTYQGILAIVQAYLSVFENIGRLSNATITAPAFNKLPAADGDMIVVPNAWVAYYNDNLRKVQIQGTLYISQS